MRFLLINTNPAVSKLIDASLSRIGHEVTEVSDYNGLSLDTYIAIIIDSDSYKEEHANDLLAVSLAPSLIYLNAQDKEAPKNFQYILKKPFLPTDFLAFIVSILNTTPELRRFITPESKQFENMPLSEGTLINNGVNDLKEEIQNADEEQQKDFADHLEGKNPIFDIKESFVSQTPVYNGINDDIFSNFSDELNRLYDNEESESVEQDTKFESEIKSDTNLNTFDTKENALEHEEKILEQIDEIPQQELNTNNLNFILDDKNDLQINTQESFDLEQQPKATEEVTVEKEIRYENLTPVDDKINFDFNVFEKPQDDTISHETDFVSDAQDRETLEDNKETEGEIKLDFGFENLAKEFDDLIKGDLEDTANNDPLTQQNEDKDDTKIESKIEHPKYEFEDLNEKDMQKALQDSGMLPPSKDIEIAKAEIGQVVEQSVKGMLQSQILREVLKGLKMNITITFEDKD
ncbi:MAG: hypothetical protein LBS39_04445 [Campylobacteraceae bacterium]|nr:hypothetical protein [Campylobacteraceae bacterium]